MFKLHAAYDKMYKSKDWYFKMKIINKNLKRTASVFLITAALLSSCSSSQGGDSEDSQKAPPAIVVDVLSALDEVTEPDEDETADSTFSPSDDVPAFSFAETQIKADITATHAAVLDTETGKILYSKGWDEHIYPASTTKLLTALFALSVCPSDTEFTPGDELDLVASDSSVAYIKRHHRLSLEMLVEGMLLPSGNDAAYVVAAGVGRMLANEEGVSAREAVTKFMVELNLYGKKIGLKDTQFTCPDGYHNDDHYTTLEDMLLIAELASENEIISKYASVVTDEVTYASGHKMTWSNTNSLIDSTSPSYYKYATGLKTGTTEEAGYCLVATAEKDGKKLIACVFGCKSGTKRFAEAKTLFEKSYDLIG